MKLMVTGRLLEDETTRVCFTGDGLDLGRDRFWPAAVPNMIKTAKMIIAALLTWFIDDHLSPYILGQGPLNLKGVPPKNYILPLDACILARRTRQWPDLL